MCNQESFQYDKKYNWKGTTSTTVKTKQNYTGTVYMIL